jgi:ribosomal protein L35AE/L33A
MKSVSKKIEIQKYVSKMTCWHYKYWDKIVTFDLIWGVPWEGLRDEIS